VSLLGRTAPRAERARRGALLIEVLLAATILVFGICSAMHATLRGSELQRSTHDYTRAMDTTRDVLERLRAGALDEQFAAFQAEPEFEVGGQQVAVSFPEALLLAAQGGVVPSTARFRDMDGDGLVELDPASTATASLLPVRVVVRQGNLRFRTESLLTEY
jgi:hypothetical protein